VSPAAPGGSGSPGAAETETALRAAALRVNQRYLHEVVLAFGLCPWAQRTLDEGRARRAVILDAAPAPESALGFIDQLEGAGAREGEREREGKGEAEGEAELAVSIGLLIFPRAALSAEAFDKFTERVRRADRARRPAGQRPVFVLAAFHPQAAESFADAHQLVSFLRRTPDPTIQLVRGALLEQARAARPSVSDDVAHQNHARVMAEGAARVDAVLREIHRDRDRNYAAIAAGAAANVLRP
jgi:hypothetical protein